MLNSRIFPTPTQDLQREFIIQSCKLETLAIEGKDIGEAIGLGDQNGNPHVVGYFQALNLVTTNANRNNLFPHPEEIKTINQKNTKLEMIKKIHTALTEPLARNALRILEKHIISLNSVGVWRCVPKTIAMRECPLANTVPHLMQNWLQDVCVFHEKMCMKIDSPPLLTTEDLLLLDKQSYKFHLQLIAIQPFDYGSAPLARVVFNLMRLNWGLPFRVIKSEEKERKAYLVDIQEAIEELTSSSPGSSQAY